MLRNKKTLIPWAFAFSFNSPSAVCGFFVNNLPLSKLRDRWESPLLRYRASPYQSSTYITGIARNRLLRRTRFFASALVLHGSAVQPFTSLEQQAQALGYFSGIHPYLAGSTFSPPKRLQNLSVDQLLT